MFNKMITRSKFEKNTPFKYYIGSNKITDDETINRIKKLCIPPMWSNVKISVDPTSYLQVTGTDSSGKVQYIYHPLFVSLTDYHKYNRLKEFCIRIPLLDNSIKLCKKYNKLDKRYIISLILRCMSKTHARVGNDHYLSDDKKKDSSYGLTTLNNDHVTIDDSSIKFDFIGKKGVRQIIEFSDKSIAEDLLYLKKINKYRLFIDENGTCIRSNDINEFIKESMKEEFTCKDFRTYASNRLFIEILSLLYSNNDKKLTNEQIIKETYKLVAIELGHTDTISKKSYVMPVISEKFLEEPLCFKNVRDPLRLLISLI